MNLNSKVFMTIATGSGACAGALVGSQFMPHLSVALVVPVALLMGLGAALNYHDFRWSIAVSPLLVCALLYYYTGPLLGPTIPLLLGGVVGECCGWLLGVGNHISSRWRTQHRQQR